MMNKSTTRKLLQSLAAMGLLITALTQATAAELPMVQNVQISGDQLTWNAVEGATGYNIRLSPVGYFDTVRDGLSFTLTLSGEYSVIAFDDDGNFSPAVFMPDNRPSFESGAPAPLVGVEGISFTTSDEFAYGTRTCLDLDAGESCVVSCPDSLGGSNGAFIIGSATGGACSSSSNEFVNSAISPDNYSCTTTSFTSIVRSQVVCSAMEISQ